ncbi:LuxR C-terminal-related transcriptional regulator [Erwinia sp. P6884]|uniref:helix-turn-helix transcriptional regulator n=1 Tax=Erwinia sp. P6884 TaxID=3141450 RepID=UPI00318BAA18
MDDDYYFRLGISEIIGETLISCIDIEFSSGFDSETLKNADVILISVSRWRIFMCQPAYRFRKKGSVLLVFVDRTESIISEQLPVCYQSLTVIDRTASLKIVREKMVNAWKSARAEQSKTYKPTDCIRCSYARMSLVQLRVISYLKNGHTVRQTAESLGLSVKTVYAHKYNVMKKYDLKGDYDFHSLLNNLSLLELYMGVINDEDI